MNNITLMVYYMVKEAVKPRMHHENFEEYLEDVDMDCFRHTHDYKHTKYIARLHKLIRVLKRRSRCGRQQAHTAKIEVRRKAFKQPIERKDK